MNFATWEPVYEAILTDFGFSRADDERGRDVIAALTTPNDLPEAMAMDDATVAVAGAAGTLEAELDLARGADVTIAASSAADTLEAGGVAVDAMVTDLDKNPGTAVELADRGVPVAVHAHGDNVSAVRRWVPEMDEGVVLPTTQAAPVANVRNFGGFTDGDRAAFLADHLGADTLVFPGWDFDDPSVGTVKARKLRWAERLLYWLERRRGEEFAVLDGRRDVIDTTALPV